MSYLPYKTNLSGWYVADGFATSSGDLQYSGRLPKTFGTGNLALADISGSGNSALVSAGGGVTGGGTVQFDRINGRPTITGSSGSLCTPIAYVVNEATNLISATALSMFVVMKVHSISSTAVASFDNDGVISVSVGSTVQGGLSMMLQNSVSVQRLCAINSSTSGADVIVTTPITLNKWGIGIMTHGSANLGIGWNDPLSIVTAASVGTTALAAAGSQFVIGMSAFLTKYFHGEVAEILVYNQNIASTSKNMARIMDYLRAKYFSPSTTWVTQMGHGDALEQSRNVASRRLWWTRAPLPTVSIEAPLSILDANLLDSVGVAGPAFPDRDAAGGGLDNATWARGHMRLYEKTLDCDRLTASVEMVDLRSISHSYVESGQAIRASSQQRQGIFVSSRGAVRSFNRTTAAYVVDPNSGAVVLKAADTEKVDADGVLIENGATNICLRSSFVSGLAGLTVSSSAWPTGGSVVLDTAPAIGLLFDTSITANSVKIVGATTPTSTSAVMCQHPAMTIRPTDDASAKSIVFSLDHYDDSALPLKFTLQRSGDSLYYNVATTAFTAGSSTAPVYNSVTAVTSGIGRYQINITTVSTSQTYTLAYGTGSSGGANQTNHVFHVQVEQGQFLTNAGTISVGVQPYFASSRIVTNATPVTRGPDELHLYDPTGVGVIPPTVFTLFLRFIPEWSAANVVYTDTYLPLAVAVPALPSIGSGNKAVLFVCGTQANSLYLLYNPTTGNLELVLFQNFAVAATATKSWSPVRGTLYTITCRLTSPTEGELGLPANTLSVFVDGVKGTDAAAAGTPTGFSQPFYFSNMLSWGNFGDSLEGHLKTLAGALDLLLTSPYALTDVEILEKSR